MFNVFLSAIIDTISGGDVSDFMRWENVRKGRESPSELGTKRMIFTTREQRPDERDERG